MMTMILCVGFICIAFYRIYDCRKNFVRKQQSFIGALLAHLAASVVKPVISSVIKGNTERGVMRAGREYYSSLDKIKITKYFNYESWFNSVFFERQLQFSVISGWSICHKSQ